MVAKAIAEAAALLRKAPDVKETVADVLRIADIRVNGNRPWDLKIHDERFYQRLIDQGALGLAESYIDGFWDCDELEEFVSRVLRFELDRHAKRDRRAAALLIRSKLSNMQSPLRAKQIAHAHYDLGNAFFEQMLGPSMVYSCAYWKDAHTLEAAQEAKLALVCDKLALKSGDRVLDVGCGWGAFMKYAAEQRGCSVVGITVSEAQAAYARNLCKGLNAEIAVMDYRDTRLVQKGPFDKVVSLGMLEHVGKKNYALYMKIMRSLLVDEGLFLLQTIGRRVSTDKIDVFVDKYIFPNGMTPSPSDLTAAFEPDFVLEDWHSFGPHYEKTLIAWRDNFERYAKTPGYTRGRRFYRTWMYYLRSFAGAFRARSRHQLWQIVLSNGGRSEGYQSIR